MITSAINLAILAITGGLLYCVGVVVYRLTWHPLAKYPGPLLAKITTLYDTYHSYREDRHLDQFRCQQKYGDIFRYGPNHLVIQTTGALRDIYTHGKTNRILKARNYTFFHVKGFASTVHATDIDYHAFKRRVLGHGFSEQALHALEPFMIQNIDKWLGALITGATDSAAGWSSPKDMADHAGYLTFDILGDLCFGSPFGVLESDRNRDIIDLTVERTHIGNYIGNSPFISLWKYLEASLPIEKYLTPHLWRLTERFKGVASQSLKTRFELAAKWQKTGEGPRKDFVYWLSQGKDPVTGQGFSREDMLTDLRVLMVAGTDTGATTIAAAFDLLTKNPTSLAMVQKEVRQTFANIDEIVTGPRLSGCHYLRAVIDETLRLAPPVPSSLSRELPIGGAVIDGIALPAGTQVGTSAWGIHRSLAYWDSPLSFRPERWLSEYTSKEDMDREKSAFCAFSLGNRGCIGRTMAYNEISMALARVFWKFDIRRKAGDSTGTGSDGLYALRDAYVARKIGPVIEFKEHV